MEKLSGVKPGTVTVVQSDFVSTSTTTLNAVTPLDSVWLATSARKARTVITFAARIV
ncbi:MAG: hypothetical protein QXH81_10730 [Thermofilaceae archaeon]